MAHTFDEVEDRKFLYDHLCFGKTTVTFEKTNGELRTMNCTLNMDLIPKDKQPKGLSEEKESNNQLESSAIRVFDTDLSEWRSFRWTSVKEIYFTVEAEQNV